LTLNSKQRPYSNLIPKVRAFGTSKGRERTAERFLSSFGLTVKSKSETKEEAAHLKVAPTRAKISAGNLKFAATKAQFKSKNTVEGAASGAMSEDRRTIKVKKFG
jgi:hypothetical protein